MIFNIESSFYLLDNYYIFFYHTILISMLEMTIGYIITYLTILAIFLWHYLKWILLKIFLLHAFSMKYFLLSFFNYAGWFYFLIIEYYIYYIKYLIIKRYSYMPFYVFLMFYVFIFYKLSDFVTSKPKSRRKILVKSFCLYIYFFWLIC